MLKRVGESRHPCRTPTVLRNQSPMLLLKRTALLALLQGFLMTWSIHLHFFQNLSPVFPVLAVANTGSCVGPQKVTLLDAGSCVECSRNINRFKTHRLKEHFFVRRNRTKRANFRGKPLFQATYNNTTENSSTNLSFVRLMPGNWREERQSRALLKTVHLISCVVWILFFRTLAVNSVSDFF